MAMRRSLGTSILESNARALQVMSESTARRIVRGALFHGTRRARQIERTGFKASSGGEFGPGIYLTDFEPTAEFYALRVASGPEPPTVLRCRTRIAQPFLITKVDWIAFTQRRTPGTMQRSILELGYDAIIGLGLTGQPQIVAFVPEQVEITGEVKVKVR